MYPLPHTFGVFSHSVSPSFEIAQTMLMIDSYIKIILYSPTVWQRGQKGRKLNGANISPRTQYTGIETYQVSFVKTGTDL